ncbi:STAS/SEC14 domain-containing protein [Myxococcus landrumensis]|uniref:STAS/SEC14 domain-containing protein n=1 Tax=Myxococcus landrumensis TaxID=2813577 RepID=A0ABX7N389_9BACT|nr:STAS/SEC14 domain-containing protein [Myxococcus landrumus]QSQ12130.1 STAS/SEC14 domain-containing protein [Myxococcus landrumus]
MSEKPREWTFGTHRVRIEPPDIAVATFVGPISMDEVKRTCEIYQEVFTLVGPYYILAEIGRAQLDATGRRYLSENNRSEWFKGCVYVGADIVQQTFGKAISLAMLFTGKSSFETTFVKTLEDANTWVQQNRARSQRKAG